MTSPLAKSRRLPWAATTTAAALLVLSACGSSATKASTGTTAAASAASGPPASAGTMFSTASVGGLGTVVVDGRGYTVYALTSGGQKNVTCDDANGCTKVWPDLPLPQGTAAATAGTGLQGPLLGTMKESDGQTYATYGGYLMYEFSGDSGPGQANGQGINSFGGVWYALSPAGTLVTSTSSPTATAASSPTGY